MIDPTLGGLLSILLLLALMFARVHVGLALGLSGLLGLLAVSGNANIAMSLLTTTPYYITAVFAFAVVPLFMLMGSFAGYIGISEDVYKTGHKWLGGLPGGLAMATVGANALFGFVCGSSVAAAAIFTKIALPEMRKHGYSVSFACGSIASAGVLAMLIPPSTLMILYGILTEQSIGLIFIAGIIPGFILACLYIIGIVLTVRANPGIAPRTETVVTWRERFSSLKNVWGIAVLGIIVLGGIYVGVFTPTEAGAAGAFGSFVLAILMRRLNRQRLINSLVDASSTTATIFFIMIGAQIYTKFLVYTGVTTKLIAWIVQTGIPPLAVLAAILILYLFMGCLLDAASMVFVTIPVVFPLSVGMGWDPIWFAIIVIVAMEVGLITPPVGLSGYAVKASAGPDVALEEVFRGILPFFVMMLVLLALMIMFPSIVTFLPSLMTQK